MLTAFGKELRKLRIDHVERIIDMAEKLNYSPSFLSAIETGQRNIPNDLIEKIAQIYNLDESDRKRLMVAKTNSINEAKINLQGREPKQREVALLLARKFDSLGDDSLNELKRIIEKINGGD